MAGTVSAGDVSRAPGPTPIEAAAEAESVRLAAESEREAVVSALAEAFYEDPFIGWMFRDDSRRLGQAERTFELFGRRVWFRHELTFTTKGVAGAAAWIPPEQWHLGLVEQIRLLPPLLWRTGRDFPRLMRALNLMESHHPHEPHYYLPIIGVRPSWQGKGLGSALLRPMLERCDREGMPAYLEASSPRNRSCYERNGFVVTGEVVLPDGPPFWPMWREPRSG